MCVCVSVRTMVTAATAVENNIGSFLPRVYP